MKQRDLIKTAKQEVNSWKLPNGLVMAILFSFIHRVTTGESVEETFFKSQPIQDYEI